MLANGKHQELIDECYNRLCEYETAPPPERPARAEKGGMQPPPDAAAPAAPKDLVVINGWRAGGAAFNAQLARYMDAAVLLSLDHAPGESEQQTYDRAVRFLAPALKAAFGRVRISTNRRGRLFVSKV